MLQNLKRRIIKQGSNPQTYGSKYEEDVEKSDKGEHTMAEREWKGRGSLYHISKFAYLVNSLTFEVQSRKDFLNSRI
jgi:hypothetical protein